MATRLKPRASTRQARRGANVGDALEILQAPALSALPWLVHGFSTRPGGVSTCYGATKSLNLGFTPHDARENVVGNRDRFLRGVGAEGDGWRILQMKQVHSSIVYRVSATSAGPFSGDGLITDTPGLLLAVKVADCVPVLVADTKRHAAGAFHAGWRGTARRIVEKGIGEMRRQFGTRPQDVYAAIGPSIRRCCYAVGEEVRAEFESQFADAPEYFEEVFDANALHIRYPLLFLNQRAPGHGDLGPEIHLDLVKANQRQLEAAGVPAANINVIEGCTACDTRRFFSHRAEFGKTGRMMAVIGIRAD